jgi:hypothetical protein
MTVLMLRNSRRLAGSTMSTGLRLMREAKSGPLVRKLMDKEEIKIAEIFVRMGYLVKGVSDDKQKSRTFIITEAGESYLESVS